MTHRFNEDWTGVRGKIIACTEAAIRQVRHIRFFDTERGYAAAFYHFLWNEMASCELLRADGDEIIEMEVQKSARHRVYQRPDIIFHTPIERSGREVDECNFAAWAFKVGGRRREAESDFGKLDEMFRELKYPLGFFINVSSEHDYLLHYSGPYPEFLYGTGVLLAEDTPKFALRRASNVLQRHQ